MAYYDTEINKAKYWLGVTYPENMRDSWQDDAPDMLQVPFAYCIHNKDKLQKTVEQREVRQERKEHVHWILVFKGPTTRKHVFELLNMLSVPGRQCAVMPIPCVDIRYSYDYLIHDTQNARKKKKHLYSQDERVTGNNFDIGAYEQLSTDDRNKMLDELIQMAISRQVRDMAELYGLVREHYDFAYFDVFKSGNAVLDRVCRGIDGQHKRRQAKEKVKKCSVCGCVDVVKCKIGAETKRELWVCSDVNCETVWMVMA